MIPHRQLIKHDPSIGHYGDCMRTCIASLLDLQPEDVPHFLEDGCQDSAKVWDERIYPFLKSRGFTVATFLWDGEVAEVLQTMEHHNAGVYWMMGCGSEKADHMVVCCGGNIVSDPGGYDDPSRLRRDSKGYVWATLLLPIGMKS